MTPSQQALRELAGGPAGQAAIAAQAGPVPDDVAAWLAGLQTLTGVPAGYLVPDARMLPPESIRFFSVDPNWTAALIDGALSLAARTAPGAAALQALRPAALAAATTAYSGFLLRSAAVADWPGLRVAGYADQQASTPLSLVRLERLAPTVLLALFAGLIKWADLSEPPQHMHFGVFSVAPPSVELRMIDEASAGQPARGGQPPNNLSADVSFRPDPASRAVIDIGATVTSIGQGLTEAYQNQPVPVIGSAALSLQFIQGTPSVSFAAPASAATTTAPAAP